MTGEEAAAANWLKTFKISDCLQTMTNDFDYMESIIQSWLWFSREGHPHSKTQRKSSADKFCAILGELEKKIGIKLSTRSRFEECIYSDAIEDWQDIFITVMPSIRREAVGTIQNALHALHALPHPLWSDLLSETFANQVLPPFRTKQYLSAVRRGCDAVRAVIREKTGLHHLDGADLVNQAYGKDCSFMVAAWEGHSEDNVRRGYTDMLRGAMLAIRNVHYHGTDELTELEAARLLVMLGTLWARAESTTKI